MKRALVFCWLFLCGMSALADQDALGYLNSVYHVPIFNWTGGGSNNVEFGWAIIEGGSAFSTIFGGGSTISGAADVSIGQGNTMSGTRAEVLGNSGSDGGHNNVVVLGDFATALQNNGLFVGNPTTAPLSIFTYSNVWVRNTNGANYSVVTNTLSASNILSGSLVASNNITALAFLGGGNGITNLSTNLNIVAVTNQGSIGNSSFVQITNTINGIQFLVLSNYENTNLSALGLGTPGVLTNDGVHLFFTAVGGGGSGGTSTFGPQFVYGPSGTNLATNLTHLSVNVTSNLSASNASLGFLTLTNGWTNTAQTSGFDNTYMSAPHFVGGGSWLTNLSTNLNIVGTNVNGSSGFNSFVQLTNVINGIQFLVNSNYVNTNQSAVTAYGIYTNFGLAQNYTNNTGNSIVVQAGVTNTSAAVAGQTYIALVVSNANAMNWTTNSMAGTTTVLTSIGMTYNDSLSGVISNGGVFYFTNISSGTGNSASLSTNQMYYFTLGGNAASSGNSFCEHGAESSTWSTGVKYYLNISGGAASSASTNMASMMPRSGTITGCSLNTQSAPGIGTNILFSVTNLTTGIGFANNTFSAGVNVRILDISESVPYSAGDIVFVCFQVTSTTGSYASLINWALAEK